MWWRTLIENQIHKAQAGGQLDNLKGEGKPLSLRDDGNIVSAGFGIMAEAGVLPSEIVLKKAVEEQRKVFQETTDLTARKKEMCKLADLQMRLSIEQEARQNFYKTT
ncbi:DnaJ family domain-containing protein [Ruegeria meonggei]|uniref:DnaJ family domain-containing protein n=1 Tax=Ruegeria meonggei TaxID=1446476 RepID=UPI00366E0DC1